MSKNNVTGNNTSIDVKPVILAGGRSKRFRGNKLFYPIDGKPLIKYTIEAIEKTFNKKPVIIASPKNAEKIATIDQGLEIHIDKQLGGPITGILKALEIHDKVMVFGGDMPCIRSDLVREILSRTLLGYSVIVPGWRNGYVEPLHAYYSWQAEPYLKRLYLKGLRRLSQAIRLIPGTLIVLIDDYPLYMKLSLYNVNTLKDLECLKEGVAKQLRDPCLNCLAWIKKIYGI